MRLELPEATAASPTFGWGGVELARWLAERHWLARIRLPIAPQTALLVRFAVLALMMGAPLIYHLYAGGRLLQFPGPPWRRR